MLPRGNFYQSIMIGTKAFKAGSTANAIAENSVLSSIKNRITQISICALSTLSRSKRKNQADAGGRDQSWATARGVPQGFAFLSYINAAQKAAKWFQLMLWTNSTSLFQAQDNASATNGATTASTNPIIELLIQEVIPGVSVGGAAPQGAADGTKSNGTSAAKPYAR